MILTAKQEDALKELINIGIGRASGILNGMIQAHVTMYVPTIRVLTPELLVKELGTTKLSSVKLDFNGPINGTAALIFSSTESSRLVDAILGIKSMVPDLDEMKIGVLTEVGNIILNGVMGSIGNIIKLHISYSIPNYSEDIIKNILTIGTSSIESIILLVEARFTVEKYKLDGKVIIIFELTSFDKLINLIDLYSSGCKDEHNRDH
ncbi:MAG: chemotaxis protein CheC [Spirochaetota bacterium]|nr:chemotaxis protein CheC [Spirochaetota bacterium]